VLSIQGRGTIALPADLRRRRGLDQPGALLRLVERDDGVIELHPMTAVPADQAWFWSERWQRMEREADGDISDGRLTAHESVDDLLDHLGD
jgi:bifunctional DNA-binding transcriptional regulator/antitoxin component of YhaV-PrlF toxin-antitoxin module